jgi:hypothetical protein
MLNDFSTDFLGQLNPKPKPVPSERESFFRQEIRANWHNWLRQLTDWLKLEEEDLEIPHEKAAYELLEYYCRDALNKALKDEQAKSIVPLVTIRILLTVDDAFIKACDEATRDKAKREATVKEA